MRRPVNEHPLFYDLQTGYIHIVATPIITTPMIDSTSNPSNHSSLSIIQCTMYKVGTHHRHQQGCKTHTCTHHGNKQRTVRGLSSTLPFQLNKWDVGPEPPSTSCTFSFGRNEQGRHEPIRTSSNPLYCPSPYPRPTLSNLFPLYILASCYIYLPSWLCFFSLGFV
jgi:hypothetical protein